MKIVSWKKQWFLSIALLLFFACSDNSDTSAEMSETDLPPSFGHSDQPESQIIKLSEERRKSLDIKTVDLKADNFTYKISIPGVAFPAPDRISLVSAPISGRIVALSAHEGEFVHKGELLIKLESLEFANFAADYLQARAEKLYQQNQLERIQVLVEKKISPQRALDKSTADFARADAAYKAAHARLLAIGVKQSQINEWDAGKTEQPRLKIFAPISGVITEHKIDLGQAVANYEEMMTIINLDKILVRGYASPEDGELINTGDPVDITLKDYPEQKLSARVTTINPVLDPINKSITINVITKLDQSWPKPGQNVRLNVKVTTAQPGLSLPLSAIEYEGDLPTVFVQIKPDTYEKRFIKVRKLTGNAGIIESGIKAGEKVAITQVFSLKALSKFEEYGE